MLIITTSNVKISAILSAYIKKPILLFGTTLVYKIQYRRQHQNFSDPNYNL